MGEYKAWVEHDLPADGWKIWIYRRAGEDKIEVIYPGSGSLTTTYRVVNAEANEESTEPSLRIPYAAGEALLEGLAAAIKPLTPREDPYVKTLLERIADLKAHIRDLREVCELGLYEVLPNKVEAKPEVTIRLDPEYRDDHGLPPEGTPRKRGEKGKSYA